MICTCVYYLSQLKISNYKLKWVASYLCEMKSQHAKAWLDRHIASNFFFKKQHILRHLPQKIPGLYINLRHVLLLSAQ